MMTNKTNLIGSAILLTALLLGSLTVFAAGQKSKAATSPPEKTIFKKVQASETMVGTISSTEELGTVQYMVTLPEGIQLITVTLTPDNPEADLAFAVRYGEELTLSNYREDSELFVDQDPPNGVETRTWENPEAGDWYVGIINWEPYDNAYTLIVEWGDNGPDDTPTPTLTYTPTVTPTPTATVEPIFIDVEYIKMLINQFIDGTADYRDLFEAGSYWQEMK